MDVRASWRLFLGNSSEEKDGGMGKARTGQRQGVPGMSGGVGVDTPSGRSGAGLKA